MLANLPNRNGAGPGDWKPENAAADGGERNRLHPVLVGEVQARSITRGQQIILAGTPLSPDWSNRMNDVAGGKVEPVGDPSLADGTSDTRSHLGHRSAGFQQMRTSGLVNRAVDTTAPEHELVGSVDDCINLKAHDIGTLDLQNCHGVVLWR